MATPPGATSPPSASPLMLPRQRPTLALPGNTQSRKPSTTSAASSAHPLRQTSFPPADSLDAQHVLAEDGDLAQYSPSADGSLNDFSDDNDIRSAISGPSGGADGGVGKKRRRAGEKKPIGRPPKRAKGQTGSSVVNGEDGRSQRRGTAGAPSVNAADNEADAEPSDDDDDAQTGAGGGRIPLYEGGQLTQDQLTLEMTRKNAFYETVSDAHKQRYDSWTKSKLKTADVRKLVNSTLGQSVPANVVSAVCAYAKLFAGMLVEEAREVQGEWTAVEESHADGSGNRALKRLRKSRAQAVGEHEENVVKSEGHVEGDIKNEPTSPSSSIIAPTVNGTATKPAAKDDDDPPPLAPGGAGGLGLEIEEYYRGPLLPDHLREALRRYKKRSAGGPVGFTGISLEGTVNSAPRMGGRRLFR
ncbi:hypothetical protein LTR62_008502 [Meristemomyces frigidus]|uniref:TAFII28-like protein domain-containing protein n=1 Tax=Meristemomyces frigidus TaxID=1508187 RepID=A0AAN7TUC5_9PEZI|nr:hypothetical protein LTR62_008502 [Meristemomyces frigidus]